MLFQIPSMGEMIPIIIAVCLLLGDILLLKLGLAITKAQEKTDFKWVAGSFGIQFGIIFFISTPMILGGWTGQFTEGPPILLIIITVIFCTFIDLNVVNILHKIGWLRSFIIVILILGPISYAMSILGTELGGFLG